MRNFQFKERIGITFANAKEKEQSFSPDVDIIDIAQISC